VGAGGDWDTGDREIVVTNAGDGTDEAAEAVNLATGRSDCSLGVAGPGNCKGTIATVGDGWALSNGANGLLGAGSASSGTGGGRIRGTQVGGGINRAAGVAGNIGWAAGHGNNKAGAIAATGRTWDGNDKPVEDSRRV
jgi:hypothetical protein